MLLDNYYNTTIGTLRKLLCNNKDYQRISGEHYANGKRIICNWTNDIDHQIIIVLQLNRNDDCEISCKYKSTANKVGSYDISNVVSSPMELEDCIEIWFDFIGS